MKKLLSRVPIASFLALFILLVTTFTLPCLSVQAAESNPECWAVIVGVSNYQYLTDLSYADDDAQALAGELSPIWGGSHVRVLTDSQATRSDIMSAIDWLADNADSDDTVLFSLSGRGATGHDSAYFYPYNSLLYGVENDISSYELANAFTSVKASKITFILDFGYSGAFQNYLSGDGRVILSACRYDEFHWVSESLQHSIFMYFVLQAFDNFDTVDTDHDYEFSAEEISEYASPRTSEYEINNSYSSIQHPILDDQYSGNLELLAKFVFTANTNLPSGTNILTLDGVKYTSSPVTLIWVPGVSHTLVVPQTVNVGSDTRYVFTGWNDGNTSTTRSVSKGSYSTSYDKEYLLEVNSALGQTQGGGWYKGGTTASFSVTEYIGLSDTRHYFNGWSGDYFGNTASASTLMNGPKIVTADWRHEYLLTLHSDYGILAGAGWYYKGETASFSVTPYIELPYTKHYFTNWSGDYSGTSSSASLFISEPKVVTANWRHEHLLVVNSEYGEPIGAGWYKEGETAPISVEPVQGAIMRQIFTVWSGDLTDKDASSSIIMNSPRTVTANWRTDYIQLYILIGGVAVLGGAVTTIVILRRRKAHAKHIALTTSAIEPVAPPTPKPPPPASPGTPA